MPLHDHITWATLLSDPQTTFNGFVAILTVLLVMGSFWQAHLTRSASRRTLRAYIFPSVIIVDSNKLSDPHPLAGPPRPGVVITLHNSGQTPAYEVLHWAQIEVRPAYDEALLRPPAALEKKAVSFVASQGSITKNLWYDRALSAQEITELNQLSRLVFVHGSVEYFDVFRRRRKMNYKLKFLGIYPPLEGSTLSFCDVGNYAD